MYRGGRGRKGAIYRSSIKKKKKLLLGTCFCNRTREIASLSKKESEFRKGGNPGNQRVNAKETLCKSILRLLGRREKRKKSEKLEKKRKKRK